MRHGNSYKTNRHMSTVSFRSLSFNSLTTKCLGFKKKERHNQETANILCNIETICKSELELNFTVVPSTILNVRVFPQLGHEASALNCSALIN